MKKILSLILLISCIGACKKSDDATPNRPPATFLVTSTLNTDGKTIKLTWAKAKDPDGDAVTYTVFAKDTLAKNISDTTYTLTTLSFNSSITGKIIAKDTKGLSTETSFTVSTASMIAIPDANFEQALLDLKIDSDGKINGFLKPEDALKTTNLMLNGRNIKNLIGIDAFTNLTYLDCSLNQLSTLDISKNTALTQLFCYNMPTLAVLDLSKNTALTTLYCDMIGIKTLDLSNNIALTALECNNNNLPTLDLSKNINLQRIGICYNGLTMVDITKNTKATYLLCIGNKLSSLDVSKNAVLATLNCMGNPSLKTICVKDVMAAQANFSWFKDTTAEYKICQ